MWRKNVLRSKIAYAKKKLTQNLFQVNPALLGPLLKVRNYCMDVLHKRRLTRITAGKTYQLHEFIQEQREWVDDIGNKHLHNWEVDVREVVEEACKRFMCDHGFDVTLKQNDSDSQDNQGGGQNNNNDDDELDEAKQLATEGYQSYQQYQDIPEYDPELRYRLEFLSKKSGGKNDDDQDGVKKLSFTEQAARRTECKKLQRFVKLVDYLMINTMHMLTVESARDLLKAVYNGCKDSDVAIEDNDESGQANGYGYTSSSNRQFSTQVRSDQRGSSNGFEGDGSDRAFEVGGVVVGSEVGTSELALCGFDGFPAIMSKIYRAGIPRLELKEIIEEEVMPDFDMKGVDSNEHPEKQGFDSNSTSIKTEEKAKGTVGQSSIGQAANVTEKKSKGPVFTPLFRVELLLQQDSQEKGLILTPSLPDYLKAIDSLLKNFINCIQKVSLISKSIPFLDPVNLAGSTDIRGLESNSNNEGPETSAIIMEGDYFRELCGRIRGVFVGIFENAANWLQTWDEVRNMWILNQDFNGLGALEAAVGKTALILANFALNPAPASMAEGGGILHSLAALKASETGEEFDPTTNMKPLNPLELSCTVVTRPDGTTFSPLVEFFETYLGQFAAQKLKMNAIPTSSIINNFSVETEKLKNVLLPSPERCFNEVSRILPGLAREKNELLLNEVQVWVRQLNNQTQNVEQFVEYLGWLEKGIHRH
jgi:dynein heavy chain